MTGSADERALLSAVCAAPDDDTPRLVYADWLDENGDEAGRAQAEFIRLQCELTRVGFDPGRRLAYYKRVRALLQQYEFRWRAALPDIHPVTWGPFARGMVDSVSVHVGGNFYPPAGPVAGLTPLVTLVCRLDGGLSRDAVRTLLDWGGSGAFDVLRFEAGREYVVGETGVALIRGLTAFAWGDRPRRLDFGRVRLTAAEFALLADWPRGWRVPALRMWPISSFTIPGPMDYRELLEDRFGERFEIVLPDGELYL